MKEKFSDIYSDEIKDRIIKVSRPRNYKYVYRAIYHSADVPLCLSDFYPTIVQYDENHEMPGYESQNRKTKISQFSVSVYTSIDNLLAYTNFIPSERNSTTFIAKGKISDKRGTASDEDETGHIDYYLFNPLDENDNCYHDFEAISQSERN